MKKRFLTAILIAAALLISGCSDNSKKDDTGFGELLEAAKTAESTEKQPEQNTSFGGDTEAKGTAADSNDSAENTKSDTARNEVQPDSRIDWANADYSTIDWSSLTYADIDYANLDYDRLTDEHWTELHRIDMEWKAEMMWQVMPEIDEISPDKLEYYYRDDIGENGGLVITGVQYGITKVRIPEYIDGEPVVFLDLAECEIKELIIPDTATGAYINKSMIEYIALAPNVWINYNIYDNYKSREKASKYNNYDENNLKGMYIPPNMNTFIDDEKGFHKFTNTKFMFGDTMYDSSNIHEIFDRNNSLALKPSSTRNNCLDVVNSVKKLDLTKYQGSASSLEIKIYADILEELTLSNSITYIHSLHGAHLKELILPDSITGLVGYLDYASGKKYEDDYRDRHPYSGFSWTVGNDYLESVVIGNGLEIIPENCFDYCINLKNVTIGERVNEIDDMAFKNCTSLESIYIPDNVKKIGFVAFADCSSLKKVSLPQSCDIMSDAFEGVPADCVFEYRKLGEASTLFSDNNSGNSSESSTNNTANIDVSANTDSVCAINMLGKTVAEVEQMYGIKAN